MVSRCIGTLTNQNRPLCGIGQTGQAVFITIIALINTAWNILIETLSTVVGLSLSRDALSRGMQVRWIDDGFYSTICSAKDASATFISIITSTINVVIRALTAKPLSYTDVGSDKIDSNVQMMTTMALTSLNNMLNQLMLGFFYPFMVIQKITVCQANGVTAVIGMSGFNISIGIPEMQVCDHVCV